MSDSLGQNFALKIFYKTADHRVRESQKAEMEVGKVLYEHYSNNPHASASISRYVVVPLAITKNFTNSTAYKTFEEYFKKLSYVLSNNAIVMNYYPMSLKDLLERGWPLEATSIRMPVGEDADPKAAAPKVPEQATADQEFTKQETAEPKTAGQEAADKEAAEPEAGRGLGGEFGDRTGYNALETISQANREKSMVPILKDVAQALSLLHGPGLRHQDIKPANILIRKVGTDIEAAIADLGFLDTGIHQFPRQPIQIRAGRHAPLQVARTNRFVRCMRGRHTKR